MNERIKELMKSAITDCFDDQLDRDGDLARMYIPNVFAEKFALLIVQECLDIVQQRWFNPDETKIANEIKEHFGVEE